MPKSETPLMRQYNQLKAKHPDALLLFRVGDFYETFSQDAIEASRILGITLTSRAGTELAGVPFHAIDTYLPKLVRAGKRVAICEQLEDPKTLKAGTLVKRGITELVTPGVAMSDNVLENRENNFLASVYLSSNSNLRNIVGLSLLDISTGEFFVCEGAASYIDRLMASFRPKEVLYEKGLRQTFVELFGNKWTCYPFDDWAFVYQSAYERLIKHFEVQNLKGFGVEELTMGIVAAGAIMHYLDVTQHDQIKHVQRLQRIDENNYVWLDKFTIRNLELFNSGLEGQTALADVIDKTLTPMGSRMLKRWINFPRKNKRELDNRLDTVTTIIGDADLRQTIAEQLGQVADMERLVSKISTSRINPREVLQLRRALQAIEPLKQAVSQLDVPEAKHLKEIVDTLNPCATLADRIGREISAEPSNNIAKGGVIAMGINRELDELRDMHDNSRQYLLGMQERLSVETGIPSLKISYTNVFGYYLEVRNTHAQKVPSDWIRKQTLTNAERYVTPELKEYEDKILTAESRILQLEQEVYQRLITDLGAYMGVIQSDATVLAQIDCLYSFAVKAVDANYCRPELLDNDVLDIKEGRHPVIETILPMGQEYTPNSVYLDTTTQQIIIITGPNMAGKSALLRQTALIVLMAQIGSYVPAESARIGLVDKIFTRVGASDNISQGESTFMVEMNESANILNNVTNKSLVLFDELGRGTSTYDGISLAWSIVEYLHDAPGKQAKTLFATHYHELNDMESKYDRIKNFNVSVKESGDKVIFLRKLVEGGSAHSFGIHVARLAGMPRVVVDRANEVLKTLEQTHNGDGAQPIVKDAKNTSKTTEGVYQLSLFQLDDPVLSEIRRQIESIDINNLTPLEALNKLSDISKLCGCK